VDGGDCQSKAHRRHPASITVLTSMAIRYKLLYTGEAADNNEACNQWETAE